MPIVVQHQPSALGIGAVAFQAGLGQYRARQDELELRKQQQAMQWAQMALQNQASLRNDYLQAQQMQDANQRFMLDRGMQAQEFAARQGEQMRQFDVGQANQDQWRADQQRMEADERAKRRKDDADFEEFKTEDRARRSLGFTGSKEGPSLEDMEDAVVDAQQKRNKIQGKEKAEADAVAFLNRSVVIAAVAVAATRAAGAIVDSGYNFRRFSDTAAQSQAGGFGRELASRQTGNQFIRDTLGGIPIVGGALASMTGINADDYKIQQALAGHKSIFDMRYSNLSRAAEMGGNPVESLRLNFRLQRQADKPRLDQEFKALEAEDREQYGEGWVMARRMGKGRSNELTRMRNRRDVLDSQQVEIAGEKFEAGLSASRVHGLMGSQSALSIQESMRGANLMSFGRQIAIERLGFESESNVALAGLKGEPREAELARIKGARAQMMAQQAMQMQLFVGQNPEAQQTSFADFLWHLSIGPVNEQGAWMPCLK